MRARGGVVGCLLHEDSKGFQTSIQNHLVNVGLGVLHAFIDETSEGGSIWSLGGTVLGKKTKNLPE